MRGNMAASALLPPGPMLLRLAALVKAHTHNQRERERASESESESERERERWSSVKSMRLPLTFVVRACTDRQGTQIIGNFSSCYGWLWC